MSGKPVRKDRPVRKPVRQGRESGGPDRPRQSLATRSGSGTYHLVCEGDFTDAHLTGDTSKVPLTDLQKQTAYAYAKKVGIGVRPRSTRWRWPRTTSTTRTGRRGRWIEVEEFAWSGRSLTARGTSATFVKASAEVRAPWPSPTNATTPGSSRVKGLVLLKSTQAASSKASSVDPYTILDRRRVMATSLVIRSGWLVGTDPGELGFDGLFARIRDIAIAKFATVHSLALQQTLQPHRRGDPGGVSLVAGCGYRQTPLRLRLLRVRRRREQQGGVPRRRPPVPHPGRGLREDAPDAGRPGSTATG